MDYHPKRMPQTPQRGPAVSITQRTARCIFTATSPPPETTLTRASPSTTGARASSTQTAPSSSKRRICTCPRSGHRSQQTSSRRSTSGRRACRSRCAASRKRASRSGCGAPSRSPVPRSGPSATRAKRFTASPGPGPTGAGNTATSMLRTTRAPSTTSSATCSPRSARRRTRRSGSTPACTGHTGSPDLHRATTTSTWSRGSPPAPPAPTSARSRTPASFSPWRTTSLTTAASWTSGRARHASSSTAPARDPTSRRSVARKSRFPAGDDRPG